MATDDLVHGYAQALFTVAEAEGALDTIEKELFAFAAALEQNTALREALTDPSLPTANKEAVIDELLGDRFHPASRNIARFIVGSGRGKEFGPIIHELATVAAERRRHVLAEVRTAVPLTEERRAKIAAALSSATGREVEIKDVVDPSIIGGVIAHVGDQVFDGSVASRLEDAKQRLGA
ncbi:MAG: ATP synthase F1 subunit delta [Actinobacteria bacterium]|nr:ATP synthase F1 subunit delta [Actinomycetota bacterium]